MRDFKPTTQLTSMRFSDDAAFAGQSLQVEPFTVLCGAHGSGKSTLLHYIAECLQRDSTHSDNPPFVGHRSWRRDQAGYLGGHVEFTIRDGETHHILQQNLSVAEATPSQTVISHSRFKRCYPFLFTPFDSMLFPEFFDHHNFKQGNVEQAGAEVVQTRKDLDALREILGVPYDEAVYIPSHIEDGAPIFPYVRARVGDTWIDSSSMSYGELVIHKLRWEVRHPHERTVILLDEPEANIAPRGHAALLDELARLARAANVQVIMTTHSPAFSDRVPQDWIRICVRRGKSTSLLTPSRPSDLRDALGVESPLKYFIVVEDWVAEAILRMILVTHRFPTLSETEILKAGSWRDAITTVTGLSTSRRVRSAAVLDGDQRGNKATLTPSAGIFFLPGDAPPEKVVLEYAAQHPEELAKQLHCSEASINIYLSELAGLEHHRWLDLLSNRTGQDRQHCLRSAFNIWHASPANRGEAEELSKNIEALLLSE
jgi:energy-coupling factor transporter ATP-binding protein EcfA2